MFTDFTDSSSEGGDGIGSIELKDRHEIFMSEGILHAAPCHQGVCRADRNRFPESHTYRIISILFQKGIVNDADNVTAMIVPEFIGKIGSDFLKNIMERYIRHDVILVKRIEYRIHVFLFHLPQVHRTGVLTGSGVGKVVHIFQLRYIGIIVDQSNPFCTTADVSAHGFTPCIVISTGCCIGPLSVDHELFMVGVFVQPSGSVEECSPVIQIVGKLSGSSLGKGGVVFVFCFGHPGPPLDKYNSSTI
ncbi:MAG: hypothetical protein IJV76_03390 [Clostridia bacterium]|nr:hypothetical protein [Clostridia bacterium]